MAQVTLRRFAVLLSVLAISGCGDRTLAVNVKLLTKSCPGSDGQTVDALQSVSDLEFIVSGDGIDKPITTFASVGNGTVKIPKIPLGASGQVLRRLIEVHAHFNKPTGPVTAKGAALVEMSSDKAGPITVPIFLRPVESFVYTQSAADPTKCTEMKRARAGHTATLLPDGRVLIVGGAEFDQLGGRTIQDSAEIFDPLTGEFSLLSRSDGGPQLPRIYHTATLLRNGKVLVVGGEIDINNQAQTAKPSEIFDPSTDTFSTGPILNQARARHTATLMTGGVVVVAGGYGNPQAPDPLKSTESWDPAKGGSTFDRGPDLPEGRSQACATTIRNGGVLVLAGGKTLDGSGKIVATDQIAFLQLPTNGPLSVLDDGNGNPLTFQMTGARYALGCGALAEPDPGGGAPLDVVALAGGFANVDDYSSASASSAVDLFDPASGVSAAGSLSGGARGNLCVVKVDDSTLVFVGGYNSDTPSAATGSEQFSVASGTGTVTPTQGHALNDGRFLHQCTRLADGSILVTGGMNTTPKSQGDPLSLKSAELYSPLTSATQ